MVFRIIVPHTHIVGVVVVVNVVVVVAAGTMRECVCQRINYKALLNLRTDAHSYAPIV